MANESALLLCLSTVASLEDADRLAAILLEESLAACVQIDGPIRSHYRWQGQTHCDQEYRLMIKSRGIGVAAAEGQADRGSPLRRTANRDDSDRRRKPRLPRLGAASNGK